MAVLLRAMPQPAIGGDVPATDAYADLANRAPTAPGVSDDGSGTAAVMELARVMSQYEFEKTIVFVAFTGEEEGLIGSSLYARKAHQENQIIDGVLNNDIIGTEVSGNGRIDNGTLWAEGRARRYSNRQGRSGQGRLPGSIERSTGCGKQGEGPSRRSSREEGRTDQELGQRQRILPQVT